MRNAALLFVLLLALVGCGGRNEPSLPDASPTDRPWSQGEEELREAGMGDAHSLSEAGAGDAGLDLPDIETTWCVPNIDPVHPPTPEGLPGVSCLPSHGEVSNHGFWWYGGRWVVVDETSADHVGNLWIYDLETGEATAPLPAEHIPTYGGMYGDELLVQWHNEDGSWSLYVYNMATGELRYLMDEEKAQDDPVGWWGPTWYRPPYLYLWNGAGWEAYEAPSAKLYDMRDGSSLVLAGPLTYPDDGWMGDRLLSWTAKSAPDAGPQVYYLELGTDEIQTVPSTIPGDQRGTSNSGGRIVWMDSRRSNWDVRWGPQWDIYMYDVDTDTETLLTPSLYDQIVPYINGHLVVWWDYAYTRGQHMTGCWNDVTIYDIDTAVSRRLTPMHSAWAPLSAVYGGKVLLGVEVEAHHYKPCVFDLRAMGILDENDHVVPF